MKKLNWEKEIIQPDKLKKLDAISRQLQKKYYENKKKENKL